MGKGAKKDRGRAPRSPHVERPALCTLPAGPDAALEATDSLTGPVTGKAARRREKADRVRKAATVESGEPTRLATYALAAAVTGAKKIKKKCCRSTPRCKGCPVVLMRAARLQESGLTGKDLKKAVKKARAA